MSNKKWEIPDSVSEEAEAWAQKNDFQLIGVVCKGEREYPIVVCKMCNCPRFLDYPCDTCAKRGMEDDYKEFKHKINEFKIFLKQY